MSAQVAADPRADGAEERGQGICRTCLAPIWNEGGTVGRRKRAEGWSDRIEQGGDSLVCFKAIGYRHIPLAGREAAIYDRAYARGASEAAS
jgi:cytochrome c5